MIARPSARGTAARDLLALTKPHIVLVSTLVAAGGMALAPSPMPHGQALLVLLGVAALVGGASALNMYLERDLDRLMPRTLSRPLPARRLAARTVLVFGAFLAAGALVALGVVANPLTAALGLTGLAGYTLLYTPLKRRTPLALPVGAATGALPPLMGWTAATGELALPGLVLFAVLFLWQVPHFLAIGIYRKDEYALAGFRTLVGQSGERPAWRRIVVYSTILLPVSLSLVPLGLARGLFGGAAIVLGLGLLAVGISGMWRMTPHAAVRYFRASLIYLPLVSLGLVLDRTLL